MRILIIALLLSSGASSAWAVDWMFAPSTYTHDPATGQRVNQYAEAAPAFSFQSPSYRRSGYHHNTSVNRVGASADRLHVVEEWGRPVRPYGEWLFPYRPYSVPYDAWGPPFGGLGHAWPFYGQPGIRPGFHHGAAPFGPRRGRGYSDLEHKPHGPQGNNPWPRPWLGPYDDPPGHEHSAPPRQPRHDEARGPIYQGAT